MNERTKAIGRQAGLVFIEDGVYGQRWYSSKCGLDVSEYEKLVELIVAECMKVVIDGKYSDTACEGNTHRIAHNNARSQAASDIKRHFGVGQ